MIAKLPPPHSPARESALAKSAAVASLLVALTLVALKTWASWRTGSSAMLGSLADSALDLLASLITLLGVWVAALPADREHRFGHGKAEAVTALVQVMLIAVSAVAIGIHAARQWLDGARVVQAEEGVGVSLFAIALTFALLAWQRFVIRRTGSVAIRTDNVHYQSDLLLNLSVIAALLLDGWLGMKGADPLFAMGIAAYLVWGAFAASRQAIDQLMDHEWPVEKRQRLVELAARHPDVSNLHDLRTRTSGNRDFVQFHIDLPPAMNVADAHDVMERVERDLQYHFPRLEVLIHIDPAGHKDSADQLVEENEFARLESKA